MIQVLALMAGLATAVYAAAGPGASAAEKPNILWIVSEDNSVFWVSCYGSPNAKTPNIDQLAAEGFRYTHCYDNSAVCAPTRNTWLTGLHCISTGNQPMRSFYRLPPEIYQHTYIDQLMAAGYSVSAKGKQDFNFEQRHWKNLRGNLEQDWEKLPDNKPFFIVRNYGESHESRSFPKDTPLHADPAAMTLHAYHPDLPGVRQSYARYTDSVAIMDQRVGQNIAWLKRIGRYEDTIIIYNSDHGGVLPRSKRFLYNSGTHCPLIIRIPERFKHLWPAETPGSTVDRLVSFVDMPKTWLSLAGAEIPSTYQGTIFLGEDTEPEPAYHFAYRGRADECLDMARAIRDKSHTYIKNYYPYIPNGQVLRYQWKIEAMQAWERHYQEGKTTPVQSRFFLPRDPHQFFDDKADYENIHNLIDRPEHQEKIADLKRELRRQQLKFHDSGLLPEDMRNRRAEANGLTLYEMVRDPALYPLADYLDAADLALARDPANLPAFLTGLADPDEGIRWWAINGLKNLGADAEPALEEIRKAAQGDAAQEVRLLAAWILHDFGEVDAYKEVMAAIKKEGITTKSHYETTIKLVKAE
ncbi:MAG: sulfatase-like hydrolase/transferase [Gammaproteobacteria bacterium]|nr:sulfatase-like hydrolase/transferase [Gammaproteobacteria bacterium]